MTMWMRGDMSDRRVTGSLSPGMGGRNLALALAVAVVALSVFSVSHIHGVSDPHTSHHLLDFLFFAQAHAGFLITIAWWILFVLSASGRVWRPAHPVWPSLAGSSALSRAPPSLH